MHKIFRKKTQKRITKYNKKNHRIMTIKHGGSDRDSPDENSSELGDYSNKEMNGEDFTKAQLHGADFTGAKLINLNFTEADLRDAVFADAVLIEPNFTGADLTEAVFADAKLTNANFTAGNLRDANLTNVKIDGVDFTNATLTMAEVSRSKLRGANFKGADLTEADFRRTILRGANFQGAVLTEADFTQTQLHGANFQGAALTEADFTRAILIGADFSTAIDFDSANFKDADLTDIIRPVDPYQVHTHVNNITSGDTKIFILNKLFPIIQEFISNRDSFYTEHENISQYVFTIFEQYIDNHHDLSNEAKTDKKHKLSIIFNQLEATTLTSNDPFTRLVIGKSVEFVMTQEKAFIDLYLNIFIQDCYHAYGDGTEEGMSCTLGIVERTFFTIGDVVYSLCPESCENELYSKLAIIFKMKQGQKTIADFTQEWDTKFLQTGELRNNLTMTESERKQHFINFVKQRYHAENLWDETTSDSEINNYADKINYVFERLNFGGRRRINSIKPNKNENHSKSKNKNKNISRTKNKYQSRRMKKLA